MSGGWDDPASAERYERFCERHERYPRANAVLAERAALAPGQRVLDVAAGSGRTADAVLPRIRPGGELVCCEPAAAMAALGRRRHPGPDVRWTDTLPAEIGRFDRVVCGAAIWLIDPVERALARWAGLLAHGGALAFNVPSAYIGLLDAAGAGDDPFLTGILLALGRHRTRPVPGPRVEPPSAERIDAALTAAGLVVERWSHRERLTQATLLDWLKIPAVSERLIEATDAAAREALLDRVYAEVDSDSWRWESWSGWTAWKR